MPAISTTNWLCRGPDLHVGTMTIPVGINTAQVVGIVVIALLTANNCINLNAGKRVQNVFTVAKALSLLLIIGVGFAASQPDAALRESDLFSPTTSTGEPLVGLALFAAF